MAKKKEAKGRPEHYEKSNLNINGTFDEAMNVFFVKSKAASKKSKDEK
ncbi:MAG TPA: hypothetical protein VHB54_04790 [Mucilaginibacter sp.]|nr:hypothetical protein [Mucilaginibacter sp.]